MSDIRFDRETGKVNSRGVEVTISTKERILLEIFLESPGHILGKDQLVNLVWPERAGWNDSTNLTQLVSKLRRSLRPTGIDQFIITCGRDGYKFVQPNGTATVPSARHGWLPRLLPALLAAFSMGAGAYLLSHMMLVTSSTDIGERAITIKDVTATLHIIDSPSLQPEWIQHALEDSFDPSTTHVFAAKRGALVYIATLGKHGEKTSVFELEGQQ
jgi:DNA-binding winged helix-turn-helix (wHTH) protein